MSRSLQRKLNETAREHQSRRKWLKIATTLCLVVAAVTSYVLINPAQTQVAETFCGFELHEEHTEECYQDGELICELPVHQHTLQCFSDPAADVEDAASWAAFSARADLTGDWGKDLIAVAKTQLGYQESTRNYKVLEDGTTVKGYTRYGAWAKDA